MNCAVDSKIFGKKDQVSNSFGQITPWKIGEDLKVPNDLGRSDGSTNELCSYSKIFGKMDQVSNSFGAER